LEEDNVPILEVWRMKTEDKMCNLEKIRLECFLLIYIYIYIYKVLFVN